MGTKTIAVTETVWERLREIMKKERARSFNEVIVRLIERRSGVPDSMFGVDKGSRLKFSQAEHEEITKDID